MKPLVAAVAVLVALAAGAPVQTPEIDALLARAEAGDAEAQYIIGFMHGQGRGVAQDDAQAVRWFGLVWYSSDVANKRDVRVGRRWRADAERMHAGLGVNVGDDRARSLRPRARQLRQASRQRA